MQASKMFVIAGLALGSGAVSSPMTKVIDLLSGLEAEITKEASEASALNSEKETWCKDTTTNLGFEIKTGTSEAAELQAKIGKEAAAINSLGEQIEQLAGSIASDDKDLQAAKAVRATEAADFASEETELKETISALTRATGILQKEMAKSGGAALVQVQSATGVIQALDALVKASAFSAADAKTLTAFVQQQSDDADSGAPAAAAYTSQSGGIIDVLEDLTDKANAQLSAARKSEESAMQEFKLLEQSLEDSIKHGNKDMEDAKASMAKSEEEKSGAEGSLSATSKDLDGDKASLEEVTKDCSSAAEDYAAEKASRAEELKAVQMAKKALDESTGGASSITYGLNQVSFLQLARSGSNLKSSADLANFEAVRLVRELAKKERSGALAQLAKRMASAVRLSAASGEDPFVKVKGLLTDMISKLEAEAGSDAKQDAYCKEEMADSNAKKDDKTALIEKLSTKISQMSAQSTSLKDSVATLQQELADLAATQSHMDKIRSEESALFATAKKELTEGIKGVGIALKTLRDYYAQSKDHEGNDGAAGGIVGMLEVIEADFTKGLAEAESAESSALQEYEATTQDNEVEKAAKDKAVSYETKEAAQLDKAVTEVTADRATTQSELDAVKEYLTKLEGMCIAKPETYAERADRRASEIAGLKQALSILDGEASLLQRKTKLRKVQ